MLEIIKYNDEYKTRWDMFVAASKNGHFMFHRDYMGYHADRFIDHSLLIFVDGKLVALLPASQRDYQIVSHGGLTFGGFVINHEMKMPLMLDIFSAVLTYFKSQQIQTFRYKAIPYIYHTYPAEEDLYALFLNNAVLIKRDVSSAIPAIDKISFSGGKKNGLAKARKERVEIRQTSDFEGFFKLLNEILREKYDANATHIPAEMMFLARTFPDNIKLFSAFKDEQLCAGVIMYLNKKVAHTQYMAVSEQGKQVGALDFILHHLINDVYANASYFDFGISTENMGRYLNIGLISQKEMFGARSVMYDTYEITL